MECIIFWGLVGWTIILTIWSIARYLRQEKMLQSHAKSVYELKHDLDFTKMRLITDDRNNIENSTQNQRNARDIAELIRVLGYKWHYPSSVRQLIKEESKGDNDLSDIS